MKPQAPMAEQAVIGSLLNDRDAFDKVSHFLQPESFYDDRHRLIYKTIVNMVVNNRKIDIITVTDQVAKDGNLEAVGGPYYIAEISSKVASSANVEEHATIVAQKAMLRQLMDFGGKLDEEAAAPAADADVIYSEASETLTKIGAITGKKGAIQIDPVTMEVYKGIDQAAANNSTITGVPSFYNALDEITLGFRPSDLIIIGGRTSMGKTALAISIVKNLVVDNKIPIGFFSLEMSSQQLVSRLMSNTCEIDGARIQNGQLMPDEWDRLDKRVGNLLKVPLYIDDIPNLSTIDLRIGAKRLVCEHDVKLIIVDYLQLMAVKGERYATEQERVSIISRSLKAIAKELNIPVIALSQLNRNVENREGLEAKRPRLADIRSSGSIEQDADVVILMYRPEYYGIFNDDKGNDLHGMAEAIVAKNRKGKLGTATLVFRGEYTRFENPEEKQLEPFSLTDYDD